MSTSAPSSQTAVLSDLMKEPTTPLSTVQGVPSIIGEPHAEKIGSPDIFVEA
jgi:hypothetical protein